MGAEDAADDDEETNLHSREFKSSHARLVDVDVGYVCHLEQ